MKTTPHDHLRHPAVEPQKATQTIIDISVRVGAQTPVWPGEHNHFQLLSKELHAATGHPVHVSRMESGLHHGTHIDAPLHHIPGGRALSAYDMTRFHGQCQVVDLTHVEEEIHDYHLHDLPTSDAPFLLLKTRNSGLWQQPFTEHYVSVHPSALPWILSKPITLVGIDYLSIEKYGLRPAAVHQGLLENDILILEGIDLSMVAPGKYFLQCPPLSIAETEAAPARALLWELDT